MSVQRRSSERHVLISAEAHRRLKLFSAKYGIPMKVVLDWFIYTLIDEDGNPDLDELRIALDRIRHDKHLMELLMEYKREHPNELTY